MVTTVGSVQGNRFTGITSFQNTRQVPTHSAEVFNSRGPALASSSLAWKSYVRFGQQAAPAEVLRYEAILKKRLGAKVPGFKLDAFQKEAMAHLVQGKSVMVAAPTSSGKTLVGTFAIEQALNPVFWPNPNTPPERQRVFYTTPRKAISNEKYREFQKEYGAQNIGLMTGDVTDNPNAPVILMTTEVLRNMLYEEPEKLTDVAKVVFDECHFVNDRERGPVWEECMIHMPSEIQQIHLSATVGNAEDYVAWMNTLSPLPTALVYSDKRPVTLNYLVYNPQKGTIKPAVASDSGEPTKAFYQAFDNAEGEMYDPEALLDAMVRYKNVHQVDLLPAVNTLFSRKACKEHFYNAVRGINNNLLPKGPEGEKIRQRLRALVEEHKQLDPHLEALNPRLIKGLMKGYAMHHAGMTYVERSLVEHAVKAGLTRCVWATDTLGAGINVPERTAVLSQFTKYNGEDFEDISPSDFHQIVGRAGRRGIYEPGYVVLVPPGNSDDEDPAETVLGLVNSPPEPIQSKFKATPGMLLNLLRSHSVASAREGLTKSFKAYQQGGPQQMLPLFDKGIAFLQQAGLLTQEEESWRLTPLAKDVAHVPDQSLIGVMNLLKGVSRFNQLLEQERALNPENAEARALAQLTPVEQTLLKLKDLDTSELAFLLSATISEQDDLQLPRAGVSPEVVQVAKAMMQESFGANAIAKRLNFDYMAEFDYTFAPSIRYWCETGDWPTVYKNVSIRHDIGDFMNVVRRTANLAKKISEMQTLPLELRQKFETVQQQLLTNPIGESFLAV